MERKISPEQRVYVIAHINDRPRAAVARAAGVSVYTVYRLVREHGGELRHDLSTKREGIEETVRRHYPTMTAGEISARFGYSKTRVNVWARRLGVRHSPETEERIRREQLAQLAEARERADRKAAHEKWRRMDELRVLGGQPQQTRFRFAAMPVQARQTVWRMVAKRNYFQAEGDPFTLYYDGETSRVPTEDYLANKYGLRFIQADGSVPDGIREQEI